MSGNHPISSPFAPVVALSVMALSLPCVSAWGLDADIDFGLPYSISYELEPVTVRIILKGGAGANYHVYDPASFTDPD